MSLQDAIARNRAAQAAKRAREKAERLEGDRAMLRDAVARIASVLAMPEMDGLALVAEAIIKRDTVDHNVTGDAYDYARAFVRCYRDAQRAAVDVSETLPQAEVSE